MLLQFDFNCVNADSNSSVVLTRKEICWPKVIARSDIERVAREIGEAAKAERVVRFGSVSFVSQALRVGETVYAR